MRDGGYINEWQFGESIKPIISGLNNSNIDIIELGFLRNGEFEKGQTLFNTVEQASEIIPKNLHQKYSLMIRPDHYDIKQLKGCSDKVSIIRFAFYLRDIELLKQQCNHVREKGYIVILNPINISSYSPETFKLMLETVNIINPKSVTIVDTFGSLTVPKIRNYCDLIGKQLDGGIATGCHLHENMLMSSSLIQEFINKMGKKRELFLDGSLDGMGRAPGNLPTEILADIVNNNISEDRYSLENIYEAISNYILPIKDKYPWGYSPAYYYSGKMSVDRSYPEYYLNNEALNLKDIKLVIDMISRTEHKWAFKKDVADNYLKSHLRQNPNR